MEEGICFVNLAVIRAVCIIQKVRGTIIVDIITLIESNAIKCIKTIKHIRKVILFGGRVRIHWLLLLLLTNNRKFLFSESFPSRPHKDISEIGHSLNLRKRLTYIDSIVVSNCQNNNKVYSNSYRYKMYPNSTHRFFGEIFVLGLKTGIDSMPEKSNINERSLCITYLYRIYYTRLKNDKQFSGGSY